MLTPRRDLQEAVIPETKRAPMGWDQVRTGALLARRGDYAQAEQVLGQACEALPRAAGPCIQLGLCHLSAGNSPQALDSLDQALRRDASNPAAGLFRAVALSDLGRHSEAEAAAQALAQAHPTNQNLPTLRALLAIRQGRLQEGLQALGLAGAPRQSAWNRPELAVSSPLLGRLMVEVERHLLAYEIPSLNHAQAVDEPPSTATGESTRPASRLPTLLLYAAGGAVVMAMAMLSLRYLVEPDPELPPLMGALLGSTALSALLITRTSVGERYFPSWMATLIQRRGLKKVEGSLRQPREQRLAGLDAGLAQLERSQQLAPEIFRSSFYLGEALLFRALSAPEPDSETLLRAREHLYRSWVQDGINPYLNYYLGKAALHLGEVAAARTYYERALERFEKLPEGHYGVGQCALLGGDELTARQYILMAVNSDLQMARDRLRELELLLTERGTLDRTLPELPPVDQPAEGEPATPDSEALPDSPDADAPADPPGPKPAEPPTPPEE